MSHAYRLALSEEEIARYRLMAALARQTEEAHWAAAGIVPGARVADIGCGAGAILVELARAVAPNGTVDGVERDPDAVAMARRSIAEAGVSNARVLAADAEETTLNAASYDVVMLRHVLIHNPRPRAEAIVAHLCTLLRPGGRLYVVDSDLEATRVVPGDADLQDLADRYVELLRRDGNDVRMGSGLGLVLLQAGLELEAFEGQYVIGPKHAMRGMRGPAWAAREHLIAADLATWEDLRRWEAAYARYEADPSPGFLMIAGFRAVGRWGSASEEGRRDGRATTSAHETYSDRAPHQRLLCSASSISCSGSSARPAAHAAAKASSPSATRAAMTVH